MAAALAQRTAAEGRRTLLLGRESIEVSDAPENLEVRDDVSAASEWKLRVQ